MNPDTVYAKTEKGRERFDARDIPTNLRHALILVDGRSTLQELLKKGEGLALLEDSLEMLEEMGLMAPVGTEASPTPSANPAVQPAGGGSSVKRQLLALAIRILGDKSDKIIRKIDETADSNPALMHTIESCGKVIKLTIDEKKAEEFLVAAKDLMAKNS
jgi:alkylated DNA repair dioxygenase AlkB